MPTIPYIIKSFRGGVSDESDKGISGSFKHGYGLNIHDRDDILTANQAMSTVEETLIGDLVKYFVPATDGSTYCFGSSGSIYVRSSDGAWNFAYNDTNGEIKGAAQWKISDGNNYLFWATSTSIARKLFPGNDALPWADVTQDYKTTLESVDYHTMRSAGGLLAIANGNYLATIDFTGSFNAQALNLRPGNLIKTLEERDDYVILGSYRLDAAEEGHIWSWITTARNWVQKKLIPVKGVNALISTEMMLLQGGSDGELFFSDFTDATPLHGIQGGGQVFPDGVSIEDDLAVFGIYGGDYPGVWSYGRKRKNRPFALNYEYRLAKTVGGSTISSIGALAVVDGVLLASWGTTDGSTSDYGVDQVNTTTKATALYEGLEFDGEIPHLKKIFNTVKLVMSPMPASTSVAVKYKIDKATTGGDSSAGAGWKYAFTGGGATSFSSTDAVEAVFTIGAPANIYEVGVEITPSSNTSPEILAVVTYIADASYDYA